MSYSHPFYFSKCHRRLRQFLQSVGKLDEKRASMVGIFAVRARRFTTTPPSAVGTAFVTRNEVSGEPKMSHLPCGVEVDVRTFKRGVCVAGAIVEVHRVTIRLIVSTMPLLTVLAEEVGRESGLGTVLELCDIVGMVDNVPVPASVNPEVPETVCVSQSFSESQKYRVAAMVRALFWRTDLPVWRPVARSRGRWRQIGSNFLALDQGFWSCRWQRYADW
jgi:hypothetical protein